MATAPTAPAGFDWKSLLPVLELAGNTIVSVLVPGGVAFLPLIGGIENALNPLIQSIGTKQSTGDELMIIYGTIIGTLTIVQQTPGVSAEILAKVAEYIKAAQDGTAAYLRAAKGFDPANYQPVAPIA